MRRQLTEFYPKKSETAFRSTFEDTANGCA